MMQAPNFEQQIKQAEIDLKSGRFEQAARTLIPIVNADPENYIARQHLTIAYSALGYFEEAAETFRPNFLKVPEVVEKYTYFGNLCLTAGLAEEAVTHFSKADQMQPGNADIKTALGESYIPLGHFKQAEKYFLEALVIKPGHARALCFFAEVNPDALTPAQVKILETVFTDDAQELAVRADTGFLLGRLLQRAKKHDEAFGIFARANVLQEKTFSQAGKYFQPDDEQKNFNQITGFFTRHLMENTKASESDVTPIFIIGLPRSGTTLLEQIIASHDKVFAGGEQKTLGELYLRMERMAEFNREEEKESILGRISYPWLKDYFQRMGLPKDKGFTHTTDKMPLNFPYVGAARYAVPNAKFVLLRRNPLDTCLSMYFRPLTASYPASVSLPALAAFYNLFEQYNAYWQQTLPTPMYELRYEDIVTDTEGEVRKLLDYLDLPWNDACLEFHKGKQTVKTMSNLQIREPVSAKYVDQWKNYEKHIAPLTEALDKTVLERYGLKK